MGRDMDRAAVAAMLIAAIYLAVMVASDWRR